MLKNKNFHWNACTCIEVIFLLAFMASCYFYGWNLLDDARTSYAEILDNPDSIYDASPWSLVFSYAFIGFSPVFFVFMFLLKIDDRRPYMYCFIMGLLGLVYFISYISEIFPQFFNLWKAATIGALFSLVIAWILFRIFAFIDKFIFIYIDET